ncbi:MAG: hypothetical protein JNJ71_05570 [Rubrivivax sp.]|nr:hypothetical protein [Rubrivivax sp.]
MLDPLQALQGAARKPWAHKASSRRVLVLGGAGALGSALLEQLLAGHRFERVAVVVEQPMHTAARGLLTVGAQAQAWRSLGADTAVIAFDRERHSHGRELAFLRPQPAQLLPWARQLREAGVSRLLIAVPHRAHLLPQALRQGLATLDEAAVAGLGFEQLAFMRLASDNRAPEGAGERSRPQALADWMLSQLHWMIPVIEQPVRTTTVARVAVALLLAWPEASPATRVLPAALLWHAAQGASAEGLVRSWLADQPLPAPQEPRRRW